MHAYAQMHAHQQVDACTHARTHARTQGKLLQLTELRQRVHTNDANYLNTLTYVGQGRNDILAGSWREIRLERAPNWHVFTCDLARSERRCTDWVPPPSRDDGKSPHVYDLGTSHI
jgi:hypothetical protein